MLGDAWGQQRRVPLRRAGEEQRLHEKVSRATDCVRGNQTLNHQRELQTVQGREQRRDEDEFEEPAIEKGIAVELLRQREVFRIVDRITVVSEILKETRGSSVSRSIT